MSGADVVIAGSAEDVAGAVYGDRELWTFEATGALSIDGDHALADCFLSLFPVLVVAGSGPLTLDPASPGAK